MLTDKACRQAKPRERQYEIPDTRSLYLRIGPGGRKSWLFRYELKGRARALSLGVYPAVTLAHARAAVGAAKLQLAQGIDPAGPAKPSTRKTQDKAYTVAELVELYGDRYATQRRKNWSAERSMLRKHVLPPLGDQPAREIRRRDVIEVLERAAVATPVAANRCGALLVQIFNWGVDRALLDASQLAGLRPVAAENTRSRVLNEGEIAQLWHRLDDSPLHYCTKTALRLMLMLGQRPGEIVGMAWEEFDLTPAAQATWVIPAERMKPGFEHSLPLPVSAVELLGELRAVNSDTGKRWPLSTTGEGPYTRPALSRAVQRHQAHFGLPGGRWTPHDLRRSVRSQLGKLGTRPDIAERILSHAVGSVVARTYDRYTYADEMRAALETWSSRLSEIVRGGAAASAAE